ncbi:MAG: conjugative transposon protein TraM [Pedobacter sp.]|nr:MAG: conjugative transposon protein TraM [Pedobacter sp.]
MKDSNKIKITEGESTASEQESTFVHHLPWERYRKPVIYFLMAAVCVGCLYLIFKPKPQKLTDESAFNSGIPQAKEDQMQADKQKAYEQQLLEQKAEEKKSAMTTLSDYWSNEEAQGNNSAGNLVTGAPGGLPPADQNAVNSYRNAQQTLSSFYGRDDHEVDNLRREITRLKNEAVQNNAVPSGMGVNDQLELMEKSYELAAKYLPVNQSQQGQIAHRDEQQASGPKEKLFTAIKAAPHNVVSSLHGKASDSTALARLYDSRFFGNDMDSKNTVLTRNAIRAIVPETKTVAAESHLPIRISEDMRLGQLVIAAGTLLKASAKFQGGRLQLTVSSIEYQGNIYHVEMSVYDNDGQPGLYVPYTPEQNAVTDILGGMGQTSGTSIMMTQSAGQQAASDLSRGVLQGVSGYFQKRVRQPKVTVKSGHQVFLVSKK